MAITKKLRFEVFKRDKFTCQYCGDKAPDVVLHVDHIEPRSKGGSDDLMNLITACQPCNSGKSDRRLADDAVVEKRRSQIEELQERREQLEMMMEWQRALTGLDEEAIDQACEFFHYLVAPFRVNEAGRLRLAKIVRKWGVADTVEAIRKSVEHYVERDDEGNPIGESVELAYQKIGGVCRLAHAEREKPYLKHVFYARGIIRNRFGYYSPHESKEILEDAFLAGASVEEVNQIAKEARNWTRWKETMWEYIDHLSEGE